MLTLGRRRCRGIGSQADVERVEVHEDEAHERVHIGDEVERIQREIGEEVVLPRDFDRVELGVGRRGPVERKIDDRQVEPREPGKNAAVGQIEVGYQHEVDVGGLGSRRVLLGELALLPDRDHRALRVAVDHQMVVAVLRHRRLQISEPGLDRLLVVEVEEP